MCAQSPRRFLGSLFCHPGPPAAASFGHGSRPPAHPSRDPGWMSPGTTAHEQGKVARQGIRSLLGLGLSALVVTGWIETPGPLPQAYPCPVLAPWRQAHRARPKLYRCSPRRPDKVLFLVPSRRASCLGTNHQLAQTFFTHRCRKNSRSGPRGSPLEGSTSCRAATRYDQRSSSFSRIEALGIHITCSLDPGSRPSPGTRAGQLTRKPFCARKSICPFQAPESGGQPCEMRRKVLSPIFVVHRCGFPRL
jgi:hypothetical protein